MSSINFNVRSTPLGSQNAIERLQQQTQRITAQYIQEASVQSRNAKEQLRLVQDRLQQESRQSQLQSLLQLQRSREGTESRIHNLADRGDTLEALKGKNKERLRSGEITITEYNKRKSRIENLRERNEESVIRQEGSQYERRIKEQQREQTLQSTLLREQINTIRSTSQQQVNAVINGDRSLESVIQESNDPQERLVSQLTQQQVRESTNPRGLKDTANAFQSFVKAMAVDRVGGMISQLPGSRNELDFIKPLASLMGMGVGGAAGLGFEAATVGQIEFTGLGAQIGEKAGEFMGESLSRTYKSRDELTQSNFKLKALIGDKIGEVNTFGKEGLGGTGKIGGLNQSFEKYGLDFKEASELQYQIAIKQGNSQELANRTNSTMILEKGVGLNKELSLSLLELFRSNKSDDRGLVTIVGGMLEKGKNTIFNNGDKTFLSEFLSRNFTTLQKQLLQTQNTVKTGTTFDILERFDSVGGQFSSRDNRSTELISKIQSSLSNPGSDSMKALAFYTMKKNHPEMGMLDTQIEIQKGMGSSTYLSSLMTTLNSMGGSYDYKVNNLASALGLQDNLSAAKTLFDNQSRITEKGFVEEILSGGNKPQLEDLALKQTGKYEVSTAEIENKFIESTSEGLKTITSKTNELFGTMIEETKKFIVETFNEVRSTKPKDTTIETNRPTPYKEQRYK